VRSRPYAFFQRTLEQLARRTYDEGRLRDGKLPQHLAVCITKFDDPRVYQRAYRAGVVLTGVDEQMTPRVPEDSARAFLEVLCARPDAGSAPLVLGSIDRYFDRERVGYFVSSAIGFFVGNGGRFLAHDFVNVKTTEAGDRIRGEVMPINVLEPFLWLEKRLTASQP
jgi:hypothetical protein